MRYINNKYDKRLYHKFGDRLKDESCDLDITSNVILEITTIKPNLVLEEKAYLQAKLTSIKALSI